MLNMDVIKMLIFSAVFIFLLVWILAAGILFSIFYREKPIDKLKYYEEDYAIKEKLEKNNKDRMSPLKAMASIIPSRALGDKWTKNTEDALMKADIPITPAEFLVVEALLSASLAFLAFAISKNRSVVMFVYAISWRLPYLFLKNRKKERIKQFNYQLNEGIMIISNSLKAGYSFLQAIAVVVEETKEPFSKEFKKLLKEMSLGISEEDALKNLLARMESDDLRLIVNAILIQKDIGGNLSEILDNISETIRERQKIQDELKTLTAQGRLSGIIVMLIPVFLGIVIYLFNRDYIMLLFTTPVGIAMIAGAVFNELIGFFMIRKIISIEM